MMETTNMNTQPDRSVLPNVMNLVDARQERTFAPGVDNIRPYRDALGQFGTGVTIITAATKQGPIGMTVNSFSSVSLSPALVLWSIANRSGRFKPFLRAKHYSIHVLCEDQYELAMAFSRDAEAFDRCDWTRDDKQVPLIADSLARFDCVQNATHNAGDHTLIIGQVQNVVLGTGRPLMFAQGDFGCFELTG